MKNIGFVVVSLVLISVFASSAVADEKLKFEVGYNGLEHRTTYNYPHSRDLLVSGTKFDGNGVHGSGSVKLLDKVSITARFDHNFLDNSRFFEITKHGDRSEPNFNERRGFSQRAEGLVGFRVPIVGTLEAGVARHYFGRHWFFPSPPCVDSPCGPRRRDINYFSDTISWGPVIGLTRELELGSFVLGGGVWGYPRMSQRQESSSDQRDWGKGKRVSFGETASGIKFEVTGGYKLTSRTVVKGGYQYFCTSTPDPFRSSSWRADTVRTEHAIIARLAITF